MDHSTRSEACSSLGIVILIALIVYVGGYAIGIGNVAWQRKHLQDLFVA